MNARTISAAIGSLRVVEEGGRPIGAAAIILAFMLNKGRFVARGWRSLRQAAGQNRPSPAVNDRVIRQVAWPTISAGKLIRSGLMRAMILALVPPRFRESPT